jgi:lipoprotein-anchoring transpeptidase ErfK/SrfK
MEGTRVSGQGFCWTNGRLWQLAVLAATGALFMTPRADAATYFWQDSSDPVITNSVPKNHAQRSKASRSNEKKSKVAVEKESKPQGPLVISISIAQQRLRLYDSNGLYAESPISSGMPGHSTPMGVFSVIQKQKLHHSNIYSGAPMPLMQRITWSGIALHAGILPGHPASHGCIRMPMSFAVKLYSWTRMGARVIVTPGNVTPESFSHPLLATMKVAPQPVAAQETKSDVAAIKAPEQPVGTAADLISATMEAAKVDLRPTVGETSGLKSATEGNKALTQTADASGALPANTASDARQKLSDVASSSHQDAPKTADNETKPAKAEKDQTTAAGDAVKPEEAAKKLSADPAKADASVSKDATALKSAADAQSQKAASKTDTVAITPGTALKADLKGDPAQPSAKPVADFSFKKSGQIAVFVSRKDSKLYIRQDFAPLFQIPVTIAADERPLGTHVFTAQVDSTDSNTLRWSVVSLPATAKSVERHFDEERGSRSRKGIKAAAVDAKPLPLPDTPAEALDRLSLPPEVMAKIYEAVSTGGSMIVSDQGVAGGETGEGTDFIVSLR